MGAKPVLPVIAPDASGGDDVGTGDDAMVGPEAGLEAPPVQPTDGIAEGLALADDEGDAVAPTPPWRGVPQPARIRPATETMSRILKLSAPSVPWTSER